MKRIAVVIVGILLAAQASAVPPDKIVYLKLGESRFEHGPQGHWLAESLDPQIVKARAFETEEVFLTGKKAGQTLMLLSNKSVHEVLFWKVIVGSETVTSPIPETSSIEKKCKCDLATKPISCRVLDKACVEALRQWIAKSNLQADGLRLVYTAQSLQEVLKGISGRLNKEGLAEVKLVFAGANLRVEGTLSDHAAWKRLMQIIYEGMVGKLLLEDRTRVMETSSGVEPVR